MGKKIAVIAVARTASKRLPNKVTYSLGGKPAFVQIIERITNVIKADYVVVACTQNAQDDPIELLAGHYGIDCFRGPEDWKSRVLLCADRLGLSSGDWLMMPQCDVPLGLADWIPFAMEQMEKHNCSHIRHVVPSGTLPWAFWPISGLGYWGEHVWTQYFVGAGVVKLDLSGYNLDEFMIPAPNCRILLLNQPIEYLKPWPWGTLHLDHDAQAGVIKEIYRRLYRGMPIDPLDVYELFTKDPRLAEFIPVDLPLTMNPVEDKIDSCVRNVRLNADYVEVRFELGKGSICLK